MDNEMVEMQEIEGRVESCWEGCLPLLWKDQLSFVIGTGNRGYCSSPCCGVLESSELLLVWTREGSRCISSLNFDQSSRGMVQRVAFATFLN